ncbi:MAG: zinc ribbon domain-containing protein [Candidatus Helarchaeota archaeon]
MDEYRELFICEHCKNPLIVGIINIVKDQAQCIAKCKKGHKKIIKLPMNDKLKWIDVLTEQIYHCRCGEELTDLKMSSSGGITNLVLYCKKHHERTRKIPTILWNAISSTRSKLLEESLVIQEDDLQEPSSIDMKSAASSVKVAQIAPEQTVSTISIPENNDTNSSKPSFCPTCGEPLPEGATKFCPSCGMEL